jgi:hypothetical protein
MKKPSEWNEDDIFKWTMGAIIFVLSFYLCTMIVCSPKGIIEHVNPSIWFFGAFCLGSILLSYKEDTKWTFPAIVAGILSPVVFVIYLLILLTR